MALFRMREKPFQSAHRRAYSRATSTRINGALPNVRANGRPQGWVVSGGGPVDPSEEESACKVDPATM